MKFCLFRSQNFQVIVEMKEEILCVLNRGLGHQRKVTGMMSSHLSYVFIHSPGPELFLNFFEYMK